MKDQNGILEKEKKRPNNLIFDLHCYIVSAYNLNQGK